MTEPTAPATRAGHGRASSTVAVLGALIRRDLMRSLRRVRPFLLLALAVAILSLIVAAGWPDPSYTLTRIARSSRELVMLFGFFCIVVAGVVLPAYGSMSVVLEREQDTLDLLSMTLIPPWGLLLGKLINTLGLFLLFVIAGAPMLGLLFCLVGLDLVVLGQTLLVVVTTALSIATLSVMWSIRARRSIVALICAYLSMLFVMGAHLIPIVVVVDVMRIRVVSWSRIEDIATVMSPFFCLGVALEGRKFADEFALSLAYQLTLALLAFLVAWRLIRHPLQPHAPRRVRTARRPITRALNIVLGRAPRFKPIGDRDNPILRAETRWSPIIRPSGRRVMFLVLLLIDVPWACILGYYGMRNPHSRDDMLMFWTLTQGVLACAVAPAITGNILTKERDLGNLDMLRMALLKPRNIVLGKIGAAVRGVRPVVTAAVLTSLPLMPVAAECPHGMMILASGLAMAGLCGVVAVCFSMLASMLVKNSTTAVILSYTLSIAFIFLLYPGWEIGGELLRELSRAFGHRIDFRHNGPIGKFFIWFSPVFSFVEQWEGRGRSNAAYWLTSAVTNLGVCAVVVAGTVMGFKKRYMKEK
jgi:hypothetical protein